MTTKQPSVEETPTPERSVEEIVEELRKNYPRAFYQYSENGVKLDDWLTQTLQTERQKREEVVRVEKERIAKILLSDPNRIVQIVGEALIQPTPLTNDKD